MDKLPEEMEPIVKLLAWKRHEQPPPGYFQRFPSRLRTRLEAERTIEEESSSWWSWLVDRFDAKPVLACAYALSVSGLLLAGFSVSRAFEKELAATPVMGGPWLAATPAPAPLFLPADPFQEPSSVMDSKIAPAFRPEPARILFMRNDDKLIARPIQFLSDK